MTKYLQNGLSREELIVVHRALGFAPLRLYPETEIQAAAAKVYGRVRRAIAEEGLEEFAEEEPAT